MKTAESFIKDYDKLFELYGKMIDGVILKDKVNGSLLTRCSSAVLRIVVNYSNDIITRNKFNNPGRNLWVSTWI